MDEAFELIGEAESESEEFVKAALELSLWSGGGVTYADVVKMTPLEMRTAAERLGNKIKIMGKALQAGSPTAGLF